MIRFGLRLAVAGGREAVVRLVTMAAAVALGVGLLLAILAGVNGVQAQNARYAWLYTGTTAEESTGPLWWLVRQDYVDGHPIGRIDVAATDGAGTNMAGTEAESPVPPGLPALPGPGQYYASPELAALLAATPAAQLGDRFPGRLVGTIGPAGLPAPNSLIIIVGRTPGELAHQPGAVRVGALRTAVPGHRTAALNLVLSVVAGGLLFPVLIFIGTATRLSAARREQRFAAMRLVGATPRQVGVISAAESTAAAVAGTALGFGLFLLFRDRLAAVPFTGEPFFPADLTLSPAQVLLAALGIPAGAVVAARLALRRVGISPLGVARRVTPRPPRPYRLVPLLLGLGELTWFIGRRPSTSDGQVAAFLPGLLLVMAGLVIAGPWLTMVGARVMARRAGRPANLIAARRLADNPQAAFRAVSGVVLALFVTSVAVGVITTIVANRGGHGDRGTLSVIFWPEDPAPVELEATATAALRPVAGVRSVTFDDRFGGRWVEVGTDGSAAAVEEARTALEVAFPQLRILPNTRGDFESDFTRTLTGWEQLANVVILASLPIAGCSLAVSVVGGLSDRKRPFSLLRLSGVPVRVLRRVLALESAVPLVIVAAVAIGTGLLTAQLFLRAQMGYSLRPPGASFALIVLAGVAVSLAIIAGTLPLLERMTGPETARND